MTEDFKYKVVVHCLTYNHALYIEDALNGFTIQQTNFPFVAVIIDDASTDNEPEVIKKYLHAQFDMQNAELWETGDGYFIQAWHKKNLNCAFVVILLKYNFWQLKKSKDYLIDSWRHNNQYVAICEGDDYWTDPHKLQRQVNFMDSNPDYVAIATNGIFYNTFDGTKTSISNQPEKDITLDDLLSKPRTFGTASVLYRYSVIGNDLYSIKYLYDVMMWCYLAKKGKFRYLDCITFTYRKGNQGVTISSDPYVWATEMAGLKKELKERFPENYKNDVKNEISWLYLNAATKYIKRGQFLRKIFFKSINKCIFSIPRATVLQCFKAFINNKQNNA